MAGFAALAGTATTPARAQWMRLQRCSAALPCSVPFGIRYAPDPLIASQYGRMAPDAFSGRISFEPKLAVEIDQPQVAVELHDFAAEAARRFLLAHPRLAEQEPQPPKRTPRPPD